MSGSITRREALGTAIGTAFVGFGSRVAEAAPVPKNADKTSWVGKTVLPVASDPFGVTALPKKDATPEEAGVSRRLGGASFTVIAEESDWVQIRDYDGQGCWLEKEKVVRLADAVAFFTKALAANPTDADSYNFRGWAHHLNGKHALAIEDFDAFLKLKPNNPDGLNNRALAYAELGEFDKAIADLNEVTRARPYGAMGFTNRGHMYERTGNYAKAVAEYSHAIELDPRLLLAQNNYAWVLATCPKAAIRDGKRAVELASKACEQTGNADGMYLDTLAAAHAEAGDFTAAVAAQERALEDKAFVVLDGAAGQKRLQLYKDKKPFRTKPIK